jgi:hypothetical protein
MKIPVRSTSLLRGLAAILILTGWPVLRAQTPPIVIQKPVIQEPWTQVVGNPDLGDLGTEKQQPVDFGIWQAADGTWQIWSCIRGTKEPGQKRLFYRWEGAKLSDANWKPMGIAMHADKTLGETPGGLQAPYVFRVGDLFYMFYGDWSHICVATSPDGKTFSRVIQTNGQSAIFGEPEINERTNTRDPMVLKIGNTYYCYYSAYPGQKDSVFCRTSSDLKTWSESKQVAFGGQAGDGKWSAECPFVVELSPGQFYLFRTQHYGDQAQTSVYFSTDPMDFGINHDEGHFICTLPLAAPEIFQFEGKYYIAALLSNFQGIHIAPLNWVPAH